MYQPLVKDLGLNPFQPLIHLTNPSVHTIAATLWIQQNYTYNDEVIHLNHPIHGTSVLIVNSPAQWSPTQPIVILVHGLTGCSNSNYMTRLSRKFTDLGVKTVRVNLRNCGPGFGLSTKIPHAGASDELFDVFSWVQENFPTSPVTVIGFSLGSCISINAATEAHRFPQWKHVISVSSPLDLHPSSSKMAPIFNLYFTKNLVAAATKLHKTIHPEQEVPNFSPVKTLLDFDDFFTAPRAGFDSAEDYYEQCSPKNFLNRVTIPSLFLCSMDDPVVDTKLYHKIFKSLNHDFILTDKGGHVGFLGNARGLFNVRWMDDVILSWLQKQAPDFFIRQIF